MYPLLILTLFLVVQLLFMLQTRKNILDKARTELADSINTSNEVYTNEELSTLIGLLQTKINGQNEEIEKLNTTLSNLIKENTTIRSELKTTKETMNKNSHIVPFSDNSSFADDLNELTEQSNYLVGMSLETLNRPPGCPYGVVENLIYGNRAHQNSGGYWHFQIAYCTSSDNNFYVRMKINDNSWTPWALH